MKTTVTKKGQTVIPANIRKKYGISEAKRKGAILVHKDPEYEALNEELKQIVLKYKRHK